MDYLEVNSASLRQAERFQIGAAPWPVTVVDNFFLQPERLRAHALSRAFEARSVFSAGASAEVTLDTAPLWSIIRALGPRDVEFQEADFASYLEQPSMRTFNLHVPHVDPELSLIAIVYLNLPEQCRGGTGFYKHSGTELTYLPSDQDQGVVRALATYGLESVDQLYRFCRGSRAGFLAEVMMETLSGEHHDFLRDWELLRLIDMRFNRLVVYDPRLFHMPVLGGCDFGDAPATSRLLLRAWAAAPRSGTAAPTPVAGHP